MDEKLSKELKAIEKVYDFAIVTKEDADRASEILTKIKEIKQKIDEWLGPQVKAAYQAWQAALKQKKRALQPVEDMEKRLKDRISQFLIRVEEKQETSDDIFEDQTKINDLSVVDDIEIVVVDVRKLIKAIISGKLNIDPNNVFDIKVSVLKQYYKTTMLEIPGCKISKRKIIRKV